MTGNDRVQALREWTQLIRARQTRRTDWSGVKALVELTRTRLKVQAKCLKGLLEKSNQQFSPLQDPFEVDLGLHRWLSSDREEAYSDWLQWTVKEIQDHGKILDLFSVNDPDFAQSMPGFFAEREVQLPSRQRLDLVIDFPTGARLVIEVKKGSAEDADLDKQKDYMADLKKRTGAKDAVLLVTAAKEKEYHGFRVVLWKDICL